jgi:hypothetical protein
VSRSVGQVSRPRPIPQIEGFENRPPISQYGTGLRHCWDLECGGGKVRDVVTWLQGNRPHYKKRVTAVLRTHHSTWVVDIYEENVRVTHFRRFDLFMSERMKLWWRERKSREVAV